MSKDILLIDDEKDFSDLTSTMLEFHNLNVKVLNDPLEVLKCLDEHQYGLIVSDLMMPNMNGFELIKHIRGRDSYKETPIIVLTAKTLNDEERKFMLQNNIHLLIKPFEPQGLIDQIKVLLENT
ncbi:MAG: response regulator [Deltaproteobacteria bacterium]|nr:response regulator [Deltaproteobacteria bacterium]